MLPGNRDSFVPNAKRNTYVTTLSNKLASLDMKDEINFELRNEDLRDLKELGAGNGGSVKMVEHVPSKTIMAKKIVLIDAKPAIRKQILRELQILHDCRSPYIISFFGAFIADPNICICMEFADKGSLDGVYKKIGPVDGEVVGRVALCVLEGLTYLYDVHRIIHRDIKPCNILLFSTGKIKICDFGVSGELINSIADTFVGTSTYMSPERIQGAAYTVKSDVWSLGISLIELALGRFPFSDSDDLSDDSLDDDDDFSDIHEMEMQRLREEEEDEERATAWNNAQKEAQRQRQNQKSKGVSLQGGGMTMSILELLQHIVNEPAPRLTWGSGGEGREEFGGDAVAFVDSCLLKDPDARLTPGELLTLPWMDQIRESTFDLEAWANSF
ncbi:Pkinase-domain-containing protein [Pterulicium gracile]|uniref:Pkinase-domain-containing protein n=1 Tax=Pterulicium gracile TaxID=1884261 RepID=A0A5C3QFH3_9AGAR|nr:Pkinase-domain-containing protein [Pterula gracilis]